MACGLRSIAWVRSAISSTKKFEQFIYAILRSLFLQKVTAIESLSRHVGNTIASIRCPPFAVPSKLFVRCGSGGGPKAVYLDK